MLIDPEKLEPPYSPYFAGLMEISPISQMVNSPHNDSSNCIKPLP
jgi:hypothetical protein